MEQRTLAALNRLKALARMKKEVELARLAAVAGSKRRLEGALEALRQTDAPLSPAEGAADPAMVGARLAHRRWSEAQQRRLNQQLALVTADYLRLKPAAARAYGRATVLDRLAERAAQARRGQS